MNIGASVVGDISIAQLAEKINSQLSSALLAGAEAVAERARGLCPVDTGRLRASISTSQEGKSARVSVGEEYGIYVELGTYKSAAQPFLVPSLAAAESEILSAVSGGFTL